MSTEEPKYSYHPMSLEAAKRLEDNFSYHQASMVQLEKYNAIRNKFKELALLLGHTCPASRELSLANSTLEEAMFWANASIARNE